MPKRKCRNWFSTYIEWSKNSEAPTNCHFWTAVSVLASAVRRQVWIDQLMYQWTPNFYIIIVGPPGVVKKSSTVSLGMSMAEQIPEIKFGPSAVTWQSLISSLAKASESFAMPDGITFVTQSALTIVASELGVFFDPTNREMVDALVDLWDSKKGAWKKATKTVGEDSIENPWLNIIGCTTPSWVADNMPESMIGGGFASRCIFVFAGKPRAPVPYPRKLIAETYEPTRQMLLHDLEIISTLRGEYRLSEAAEEWGEAWYRPHFERMVNAHNDQRLADYLARKQTHIHKLALITAVAQRDEPLIEVEDMQFAEKMLNATETDMHKIFYNIGKAKSSTHLDLMMSYMNGSPRVDKALLMRQMLRVVDVNEFNDLIAAGTQSGQLRVVQYGTRQFIERTDEHANE